MIRAHCLADLPPKQGQADRNKHETANHIGDKLLRCKAQRTTCLSRKLGIGPTGTGKHGGQNHRDKLISGGRSRKQKERKRQRPETEQDGQRD